MINRTTAIGRAITLIINGGRGGFLHALTKGVIDIGSTRAGGVTEGGDAIFRVVGVSVDAIAEQVAVRSRNGCFRPSLLRPPLRLGAERRGSQTRWYSACGASTLLEWVTEGEERFLGPQTLLGMLGQAIIVRAWGAGILRPYEKKQRRKAAAAVKTDGAHRQRPGCGAVYQLNCSLCSTFEEGKQVGVNGFGLRGGHAVRKSFVGL
jgi:hypothetical protein